MIDDESGLTPVVRPTIHAVDDDESFLRAMVRRLEIAGYAVKAFSSADAFLAAARADAPGCVLADLRMPGMDGFELHERMNDTGHPLPIVFLTGHGDVRGSVRAMKRGAVDFLTKPVRGDELLDAIERALRIDADARERRAQVARVRLQFDSLTPREREVFAAIVRGLFNKEIAAELGTTERTVKAHRAQVMRKFETQSVATLTRMSALLEGHGRPS